MYFNKRRKEKKEKEDDDGVEVDRGIILPMFQRMYHNRRSTQHEMQRGILQSVRRKGGKVKEEMKERDEWLDRGTIFPMFRGMYHKGSKI